MLGPEEIDRLVAQALKNDPQAIAALYELFEERLQRAVQKTLGNKLRTQMETVDLIQSLWGDVIRDMGEFRYQGPDSFFQWLLTRLVNKIRAKGRYYGRIKRDLSRLEPEEDLDAFTGKPSPAAAPDPTPGQKAIRRERLDQLFGVLNRFSEVHRRVLILRLRDEKTYEEIAQAIGRTEDATRMLYGRALKRLMESMEEGSEGLDGAASIES